MKIGDFDPRDKKFWPKKPEPGFSVAKNKYVIESTIKDYEKQRKKKMAEFDDSLKERTDAIATYLTGRYGANRNRALDKYFTKAYMAHLRGEKIKNQLMQEQKMLIGKNKKLAYEQKLYKDQVAKTIKEGKAYKIPRTNAKKEEKSQKTV